MFAYLSDLKTKTYFNDNAIQQKRGIERNIPITLVLSCLGSQPKTGHNRSIHIMSVLSHLAHNWFPGSRMAKFCLVLYNI